eukprot:Nk52_evm30s78 gene=Nk52_evmTU30s78
MSGKGKKKMVLTLGKLDAPAAAPGVGKKERGGETKPNAWGSANSKSIGSAWGIKNGNTVATTVSAPANEESFELKDGFKKGGFTVESTSDSKNATNLRMPEIESLFLGSRSSDDPYPEYAHLRPFYNPKTCFPKKMKNIFETPTEYFQTLMNNVLAELWGFLIAARDARFVVKSSSEGILSQVYVRASSDFSESIYQNMLEIDGRYHLVVSFKVLGSNGSFIANIVPDLKPSYQPGVKLKAKWIGYIGNFIYMYQAIHGFLLDKRPPFDVLKCIVDPSKRIKSCTFVNNDSYSIKCNESQESAVTGLDNVVEVVHGPGGTGKSTTIANIILRRCDRHLYTAVVCERNKAVDSIVEKICDNANILVVGNPNRLGKVAREYTLEALIARHPNVLQLEEEIMILQDKYELYTEQLHALGVGYGENNSIQVALDSIKKEVEVKQASVGLVKATSRDSIIANTQVLLSTIALAPAFRREISLTLKVDTLIIDEAGCISELCIPHLLELEPSNMILLGDHCQLRPLSFIADKRYSDCNHDRSLLERVAEVLPESSVHLLSSQYRMCKEICDFVSMWFYNGKLKCERKSMLNSLEWIESPDACELQEGSSLYNNEEVRIVEQIYTEVRRTSMDSTIMVISFYKPQVNALAKRLQYDLRRDRDLSVASVDASQGSEADVVILSCVRSNLQSLIGFVSDYHRLCVTFSRAKNRLIVVGNTKTFMNTKDIATKRLWLDLYNRSKVTTLTNKPN